MPRPIQGVGVDEHLDARLPLNLVFTDDLGRPLRLENFFQGQRPVILSLNYSDCPMLCDIQLTGLVRGLQKIGDTLGTDYDIVTVGLNPLETVDRAAASKARYLKAYQRPTTADGWHFLVGPDDRIRKLAETVGVRYNYMADVKQYVHPAVFIVCTPDGIVSRYVYGVDFKPEQLQQALNEARAGKSGSAFETFLLYCFQFDSSKGSFAGTAMTMMKVGGLLFVIVGACVLIPRWRAALAAHH